jgi:hypothetical protein
VTRLLALLGRLVKKIGFTLYLKFTVRSTVTSSIRFEERLALSSIADLMRFF